MTTNFVFISLIKIRALGETSIENYQLRLRVKPLVHRKYDISWLYLFYFYYLLSLCVTVRSCDLLLSANRKLSVAFVENIFKRNYWILDTRRFGFYFVLTDKQLTAACLPFRCGKAGWDCDSSSRSCKVSFLLKSMNWIIWTEFI